MRRLFILAFLLGPSGEALADAIRAAQEPAAPVAAAAAGAQRLRLFLDCDCFQEYLREQIDWVDFVRQAQDADVHLLSTAQETGGGGRELVLRFVGRGRFDGVSQDLRVVSEVAAPESARREQVLQTVVVGLLYYMARGGLPAGLDLDVEAASIAPGTAATTDDPWNLWVFSVSFGASFDGEESNREAEWNVNATADRVTDRWKLAFGARVDEEHETFDLDDEDPLSVERTERNGEWFVARSLGPHWSLGLDGAVASSSFGNTRFLAQTAPAVEYSIFPYREYATRQFVIQYQIWMEHARYTEVTVFDRLEDTLGRHAVSADLDTRQPWGSLEAGIEWSQYLHDPTKYRIEVDGELSLRVVRGLSVDVEGFASRLRDQLSLPRRGATPEEVLLQLRELQSGYEVGFSVGVSYSFGSLFNNVVNPRFDNRGGGGGGDFDF